MKCFECEQEIALPDVESGKCFRHDRYRGKNKALCKDCRKPFKLNTLRSDQDLRDIRSKYSE